MSDITDQKIKAIYGMEPMREGENPTAYQIGVRFGYPGRHYAEIVTAIRYREHNYGDHGLGWFDVFIDEVCVASMQARAVAEVCYLTEEPAHD